MLWEIQSGVDSASTLDEYFLILDRRLRTELREFLVSPWGGLIDERVRAYSYRLMESVYVGDEGTEGRAVENSSTRGGVVASVSSTGLVPSSNAGGTTTRFILPMEAIATRITVGAPEARRGGTALVATHDPGASDRGQVVLRIRKSVHRQASVHPSFQSSPYVWEYISRQC